jgi:multidrug efflux pump subunit AcrA (membrane-fusion protein)
MTATVSLSQGAQARGVYLPVAAVFQTGSQPGVWLVTQGRATLRPVKLGELGVGDRIRIIEGLQPGDVVVLAGVHKLRPGQKVRSGGEAL